MIINQLTEEEIAQIKRELKQTQGHSKNIAGKEIKDKLDALFDYKSYSDVGLYPCYQLSNAIFAIVNNSLDNFVYRYGNEGKRNIIGWCNNTVIPNDIYEEYMQMSDEIIDLIKKHRKNTKFTKEKP